MKPTPRDLASVEDQHQRLAQAKITRTRSGSSVGDDSVLSAADCVNAHVDALRKAAAAAAAAAAKAMPHARKRVAKKNTANPQRLAPKRSPARPQDIACRFFDAGRCKKGTSCPFSHSAVPPPLEQSRRNGPRRRFHRKKKGSSAAATSDGLAMMKF